MSTSTKGIDGDAKKAVDLFRDIFGYHPGFRAGHFMYIVFFFDNVANSQKFKSMPKAFCFGALSALHPKHALSRQHRISAAIQHL